MQAKRFKKDFDFWVMGLVNFEFVNRLSPFMRNKLADTQVENHETWKPTTPGLYLTFGTALWGPFKSLPSLL